MTHSVFACESQPVMLEGLGRVLEQCPELRLVGTAPSLEEMLAAINDLRPQIILLGQSNPQRQMLSQIPQVIAQLPDCRIVLWVVESPEQDVFRALHLGVRGVVQKTMPVQSLIACLRAVAAGKVWIDEPDHFFAESNGPGRPNVRITPREREIIELICRGLKNREIADQLQITAGTVKVHLMHVFEKTGTKDRFQLALRARQILGINDPFSEQAGRAIANRV